MSLYILEIRPLLVLSFENIFSQFIGCVFSFLVVSLAVQELLNLIRSHLFIFPLFSITPGDETDPKNIAVIYVKESSACFPPGVLWYVHSFLI